MALFTPTPALTAQALEYGEALVAAYLGGTALEEHEVTEVFDQIQTAGYLALQDGPVTGLLSATGYAVPLAGAAVDMWHLRLSGPYSGQLTVRYKAGWTLQTVPAQVKQAVFIMAGRYDTAGVTSQAVGPVSQSFDRSQVLPAELGIMLRRWKRLML